MIKTLVVENFRGAGTPNIYGDINSGFVNFFEAFGYTSFNKPGQLTWSEKPTQIDSAGSVITDLIMAGKGKVESGINYVYCIGHLGRLYKIQVNNPTTFNPDYDNPILLATLTSGTPTFTRGGFIDFFGATEQIYIGHDKGVTRIDFAGTNETAITGTWTQNVPRQLKQFLGNLYAGNGTNIAEILNSGVVSNSTRLLTNFPINSQVRDMDVSINGTYMDIIVSQLALADITTATQDTTITSNLGSWIFKWNGVDTGYTAFVSYPLTNLTSNIVFGNSQYVFGYDLRGTQVFNPVDRFFASGTLAPFEQTPFSNALITDGGMVGFATTLFWEGFVELAYVTYGMFDTYVGSGGWSPMGMLATAPETDIKVIPYFQTVSNFAQGISTNGYANNIFGTSKVYFSTMEISSAPTTKYRFYKWSPLPTGQGTATNYNNYQTQTQMFSKKIQVKEVRVYGEPWVTNNSFSIDLIGSAGTPITGGSKTFTAGTNLTIGDDFAWYNPQMAPTYALALSIVNIGTANNTITKIEIDYDPIGGK